MDVLVTSYEQTRLGNAWTLANCYLLDQEIAVLKQESGLRTTERTVKSQSWPVAFPVDDVLWFPPLLRYFPCCRGNHLVPHRGSRLLGAGIEAGALNETSNHCRRSAHCRLSVAVFKL